MPSLGEQMGTQAPYMLWCLLCMVCIGLLCLYCILLNRCLKCGCDGGCGEHRSNKDKQEHQPTSTGQLTLTTVGGPPTPEDDYMKLLR